MPKPLRDQLAASFDAVESLRQDYNPVTAALVGAGASASQGLGQLRQGIELGAGTIAEKLGMPEAAAQWQQGADDTRSAMLDDAALYQQMRDAHPYATAVGEALPAAIPAGGAAMRSAAMWNAGAQGVKDLAAATESARLIAMANALRR